MLTVTVTGGFPGKESNVWRMYQQHAAHLLPGPARIVTLHRRPSTCTCSGLFLSSSTCDARPPAIYPTPHTSPADTVKLHAQHGPLFWWRFLGRRVLMVGSYPAAMALLKGEHDIGELLL